jgi:hypothetical protein
MSEMSLYYINHKTSGGWKLKTNKHQQIIALTTQLNDMNTKLTKMSASKNGDDDESQDNKGKFPLWRLKKVPSSAEHSMVEQDGHMFDDKTCGMYCMHKPGDGHIAWLAPKEKFKADRAAKKGSPAPASTIASPLPAAPEKPNTSKLPKLSLLKSLQSVLMIKAGISESQFKQIWDEACSSLGN